MLSPLRMEDIHHEPSGRAVLTRDKSRRKPSVVSPAAGVGMAVTPSSSSSEHASSSRAAKPREPDAPPAPTTTAVNTVSTAKTTGVSKGKAPILVLRDHDHHREIEEEEDATVFTSVDSYDDAEPEPSTFAGASHPPEPVDADTFRTVYLPIEQSRAPEPPAPPPQPSACLVKGLQSAAAKPPSVDDLSTRVHCLKLQHQNGAMVAPMSPADSLIEETGELRRPSSPFSLRRASRATTDSTLAPPPFDTEEKECIWDASLPPSPDISISTDSRAMTTTTTSALNSSSCCTSTYRSGGGGMDRNYASTIGSVIGDSLESTKTSMSRLSDSSGLSDDSTWSLGTGGHSKPHKGNDPRWKSILAVRARDGLLGMSHFRLLKRLGCGDIGSVYLSELSGTRCHFAMKVMDKASLASRKKLARAQTEREILQLLDHPFLPTLYTHFETDRFSCLVMEFCPGGDLHTLRQRQPGKYFSEYAARFYAAEVLLALEYLHMLGVVYRDLKPENVLVRDDGHIMLSDFDLSLRCSVSPTLIKTSSIGSSDHHKKQASSSCVQPSCIEPTSVCIQPACFMPRLFSKKGGGTGTQRTIRRQRGDVGTQPNTLPELVAEPTAARSMSFVGTHEYLAPEIIKGEGHGSAVDWWTFGIFLHELLYGKTPFKGADNRATLFNVVGQQLRFPDSPPTSYASRDLIRGLLAKEPQHRLGVKRGATEIKQHPFFDGVNWALIRCGTPPEVPRQPDLDHYHQQPPPPVKQHGGGATAAMNVGVGPAAVGVRSASKRMVVGGDMKSEGKYLDFEFF